MKFKTNYNKQNEVLKICKRDCKKWDFLGFFSHSLLKLLRNGESIINMNFINVGLYTSRMLANCFGTV